VVCRGVGKTWAAGTKRAHEALRDIDLDITPGEFVVFLGPSGCGKSTLLKVMAGLIAPSAGGVSVAGIAPQEAARRRMIGLVFQDATLLPWKNAVENAAFLLMTGNTAIKRDEAMERAAAMLRLVGLDGADDKMPAQLSGGMRQRVCIARTLVRKPRLILLDEPFGALDQQTRLLMGEEVLRLWRQTGATVFLITHALDEAAMLADRIAVMSARPGRFIDFVETRWPRERDSRIVEQEGFGAITARLWKSLRAESLKTLGRPGAPA